tara:strand:- start:287 stop:532 length:246 start_codon:yes stop_codon:yes gene_type:complete
VEGRKMAQQEVNAWRVLLTILAIFFSWISVLLYQKRLSIQCPINFLLWCLFFIPGFCHAVFIIFFTDPEWGGEDLLAKYST